MRACGAGSWVIKAIGERGRRIADVVVAARLRPPSSVGYERQHQCGTLRVSLATWAYGAPSSAGTMNRSTLPSGSDHMFGRRMEVLTWRASHSCARNNFHRIAREWFYGDPSATELGEQEAGFYERRAA